MATKVTIKGKKLTIEVDINDPLELSKSGKTKLLFSSRGNLATEASYEGKPVTIGLNAWIKP